MSQSRMTMYFEMGAGGWSESLYCNLGIDAAITQAVALANKRINFLVPAASIVGIGARSMDNPRFADFTSLGWLYSGVSGSGTTRDIFQAAVQVRLGAGTHISKPWLHGLPDEWMSSAPGSPLFWLNGTGQGKVDTYLALIKSMGFWQVRGLTAPLDATTPRIRDITIVNGFVTLDLPGNTFVAGDRVQVNGAKGWRSRQFNGQWKVDTVVGNTLTLSSPKGFSKDFFYVKTTAAIRRSNKADYGFFAIDAVNRLKVGSKKIGRPTFGPHGRHSVANR